MVADCALEPRSVTAASVGQEKNLGTHKKANKFQESDFFSNEIFKTAYGLTGLGMPIHGLKSNIDNLNAYTLQRFQLENIRPNKLVVCGAGIESHQEFVDLVLQKLGGIPISENVPRTQSQYQGGEVKSLNDSNETHLSLVMEGPHYSKEEVVALKVAEVILGQRL